MKIFIETERLILREILPSDDEGMFELDSDKEVHKYIGQPVETIEESRAIIAAVRKQYEDFGIGRWAMIEKSSGEFLGWSGLKYMTQSRNGRTDFHDVGYRLIRKHWGKGFATESAIASLKYGFEDMKLEMICAHADMNNLASRNVLTKIGLTFINTFDDEGFPCGWYEISKDEWLQKQMTS